MPAVSQNQQMAMAIAEHDPGKLYKRNAGLKQMTLSQLHDFAATKRSKLPKRVRPRSPKRQVEATANSYPPETTFNGS